LEVYKTAPPAGYSLSCLKVYTERLHAKIKNGGRKGKTVGYADVMARFQGCAGMPTTEFIWEVKTANWSRIDAMNTLGRYVRNRRKDVASGVKVYAGYKLNNGNAYYGPGYAGVLMTAFTIERTRFGIPPTQGFGLVRYIAPG